MEKSGKEEIYMLALADSLHTSLMISNWGTKRREGSDKIRRVGSELVKFKYGEIQRWYYFGRHAVYDNNNNRQGCLSFEEVFTPKDWSMRQFGFIIALVQTNSFLAYNHFKMKVHSTNTVSKAEYTRNLAEELINNQLWKIEKQNMEEEERERDQKRPKRVEEHELLKFPTGRGMWDGHKFVKCKQPYQKYLCRFKCGRKVRSYCKCDKALILCNECYAVHHAEVF